MMFGIRGTRPRSRGVGFWHDNDKYNKYDNYNIYNEYIEFNGNNGYDKYNIINMMNIINIVNMMNDVMASAGQKSTFVFIMVY